MTDEDPGKFWFRIKMSSKLLLSLGMVAEAALFVLWMFIDAVADERAEVAAAKRLDRCQIALSMCTGDIGAILKSEVCDEQTTDDEEAPLP